MERKNNDENNITIDHDEDIMRSIVHEGGFSHNGVSISLDDYIQDGVLNSDWIYSVARKIANSYEELGRKLYDELCWRATKARDLYEALPNNSLIKSKTNRPVLPYREHFKLVELLEQNPERYQGPDGHRQLGRDMNNPAPKNSRVTHMSKSPSREEEAFNSTTYVRHFKAYGGRLLFNRVNGYGEDETLENVDNVVDAHLGGIWYDTNEQLRKELNWENKIDLPSSALGLIDQLIAEHRGPQGLSNDILGFYGIERYQGLQGLVELTADLDEHHVRSIKPGKPRGLLYSIDDNEGMNRPRLDERLRELGGRGYLFVNGTSVWRATDERLRKELGWPEQFGGVGRYDEE